MVSERGEERGVLTHRCRAGLEEERGVVLPFFGGFEVDHCEYSPQVHIWWFGRMCNSSRTTGKLSIGPLIKPGRSEDFPIRKQRFYDVVDSQDIPGLYQYRNLFDGDWDSCSPSN